MKKEEKPLFDKWSVVHYLAGVLASKIGFTETDYLPVMVGWEILEQGVLSHVNSEFDEPWWNSATDILVGWFGVKTFSFFDDLNRSVNIVMPCKSKKGRRGKIKNKIKSKKR